jgi:hypothetical protein
MIVRTQEACGGATVDGAGQERDLDLVMAGGTHGRVGLQVGRSTGVVHGVIASTGGVRPAVRCRGADRLSVSDREDIACGVAAGLSVRAIARGLCRAPSTVSRELNRNGGHATASGQRRAGSFGRNHRPVSLSTAPSSTCADVTPMSHTALFSTCPDRSNPQMIFAKMRL